MTRTKGVIIVPSLVMGGLERVASVLANQFVANHSCDISIVTLANEKVFFNIDRRISIIQPDSFVLSNRFLKLPRIIFYLRKVLKTEKPVFVLSFGSIFNSLILMATIGSKIPVFVSDRSNPYRNTTWAFWKNHNVHHDGLIHIMLKWFLYKRAKGIVAQTELARELNYKFLKHKNIAVIGNPIQQSETKSDYDHLENKVIVSAGRFTEHKNQLALIKIFHHAGTNGWKLLLAGDGPRLEECKDYVRINGLENNIEFLGKVRDMTGLFKRASVFAFTSLSEGFPNALAEAMVFPLACISYDCISGPRDLIKNEHNGLLIPQDDTGKFEKELKRLMGDLELRTRLAENAFELRTLYNEARISNSYMKFISNEE